MGVGEDGPTHQPVETVMGLRVIPNLDVIRPADPEETAGAWISAMERIDGPTLLALTRQNVPVLPGDAKTKREGVRRGGYVLVKETAALETILIATGSEVQHCVAAAEGARRGDSRGVAPVLDSLRAARRRVPRVGATEGDPSARVDRGGGHSRMGALGGERGARLWVSITSARARRGPC